MRAWKGSGVILLLAVSLATVVWAGLAQAAVTKEEGPPITVCPAGCDYTTIGAAVVAAGPGSVIDVAAGTYLETLVLTKSLTIQGAGPLSTTIDAHLTGRVISVTHGVQVTLSRLALVNGQVQDDFNQSAYGGGLFSAGELWLSSVLIADNFAFGGESYAPYGFGGNAFGGGIYNGCTPAGCGQLHITNSTIMNNVAGGGSGVGEGTNGGNAYGGGLFSGCLPWLDSPADECATATVANSLIVENQAAGGAGAEGSPPYYPCGQNGYAYGGGVYNGSGEVPGRLHLTNTTVSNNVAIDYPHDCGPFYDGEGIGAGIWSEGELTVDQGLISSNLADGTGGGYVRGLAAITNSLILENHAETTGGLYAAVGSVLLESVTIAFNTVSDTLDAGIRQGSATLSAHHLLLADNWALDGTIPADCAGTILSQGFNLIGDSTNCILSGDLSGVLLDVDARLLAGAPLPELLLDSPALDAGDPAGCPPIDYRGFPRPVDGNDDGSTRCDMGALERPRPVFSHTLRLPLLFFAPAGP